MTLLSQTIPVVKWFPHAASPVVDAFLRRPALDPAALETARRVIDDIRREGDAAVSRYTLEFNHCDLPASRFAVTREERAAASEAVDLPFKRVASEIFARVMHFGKAGMRKDWSLNTPKGGVLGELFIPIQRVGCYIPGGTAPLASTAIMTATLAKVAGVPEIVACTPCDRVSHAVNPVVLYAMRLCGVTEVYRVGGVQAIGLMAYGTRRNEPVQKIVGPGGTFVTAAKRLVYGTVALDLVAGPSEIAILADSSANPEWLAMDLLSQAEHGTGNEKALLVTDSKDLADAVDSAIHKFTLSAPRKKLIQKVSDNGGLLIVLVSDMDRGIELIRQFAPEHFEIMTSDPAALLPKVRDTGAVFVGKWTPESAGDFAAGPSHVLPTGGSAKRFSGLTVDDFRRRTSLVQYTEEDLREALPVIEAFGAMEGLDAHAQSARIRFR